MGCRPVAVLKENPGLFLQKACFQQDRGPPHPAVIVIKVFLNESLSECWVRWQLTKNQLTRSPNRTPVDFCVWGFLIRLITFNDRCHIELC